MSFSQPPEVEKEGEGDRHNALIISVRQAKKKWKESALKKEEGDRALAQAWKERNDVMIEEARQERQARLEELSKMDSNSRMSSQWSRSVLSEDAEYGPLLEKYGHKIRVNLPALPPLDSSASKEASVIIPRRPRVPKTRRPQRSPLQEFRRSVARRRSNIFLEAENTGGRQRKEKDPQRSSAASRLTQMIQPPSPSSPNPPRESAKSQMPRKDNLRRYQHELLKKSEVVAYKSAMKAHMQRILAAVELTFDKSSPKQWKEKTSNLVKPKATVNRRLTPGDPELQEQPLPFLEP